MDVTEGRKKYGRNFGFLLLGIDFNPFAFVP
jgi:hypothetical protein